MRKPKNIKYSEFKCFNDSDFGPFWSIELESTTAYFHNKRSLKQLKKLHKWIGKVIEYIEYRGK